LRIVRRHSIQPTVPDAPHIVAPMVLRTVTTTASGRTVAETVGMTLAKQFVLADTAPEPPPSTAEAVVMLRV
jgi:hypothetical protein